MGGKLALFPMTREQCAIARYPSLLQKYVLSHFFVPKFKHHLNGMDVSKLDGGEDIGAAVTICNLESLADADVLFVDYDERIENKNIYQRVISDATEKGVEVVLSNLMEQILSNEPKIWSTEPPMTTTNEDSLYDIQVPIITVLSQGIRTDQFAVELALRKYFTEIGYNVSQIGSINASQFFGFDGVPDFLLEPRDAYDKILRFNHYVNDIVNKDQSDLIIIGVPGAIMKYNNKILQDLGILPFVISNAVECDTSILCMYNAKYNKQYFDEMVKYSQYRLDTPVRFFCISNTGASPDVRTDGSKLSYYDLDSDFVLNGIKNEIEPGNYYIFNALNNSSIKVACMAVQEDLTGNVSSIR